eukprot:Platyproteum_vivax@DN6793_c0_g1_i2.p1
MEIVHYFFVLWVTIAILQKTYWQMKMNYWQQKRFGFGCKQTLESLSLLQLVEAASVGLVVCLLVWPQSPLIAWNWFEVSVPVDVLFILMGCLSAYIMSEAHRHLTIYWTKVVSEVKDHQLIQSGPYSIVRHPMYTGGVLALLAASVNSGSFLFLVCVCIPGTMLAVWRCFKEDALMIEVFGPKATAYHSKVPNRLIPYVF